MHICVGLPLSHLAVISQSQTHMGPRIHLAALPAAAHQQVDLSSSDVITLDFASIPPFTVIVYCSLSQTEGPRRQHRPLWVFAE